MKGWLESSYRRFRLKILTRFGQRKEKIVTTDREIRLNAHVWSLCIFLVRNLLIGSRHRRGWKAWRASDGHSGKLVPSQQGRDSEATPRCGGKQFQLYRHYKNRVAQLNPPRKYSLIIHYSFGMLIYFSIVLVKLEKFYIGYTNKVMERVSTYLNRGWIHSLCWKDKLQSTIVWFVVREKQCSFAEKVRPKRQANKAWPNPCLTLCALAPVSYARTHVERWVVRQLHRCHQMEGGGGGDMEARV
jgi:predicted GIY-YIG superfamily endonuclease